MLQFAEEPGCDGWVLVCSLASGGQLRDGAETPTGGGLRSLGLDRQSQSL